jgi:signal transduction histidine kinase
MTISRWLPRSLYSRLVLVLLGGLVIAQVASLAVYWQDRGEFMQRAMGMRSVQRIADITRLLDGMTPAERTRIVAVINSPPLRVSLDLPALQPVNDRDPDRTQQAAAYTAALTRQLGNAYPVVVQVSDGPVVRGPGPGYGMGMAMGPGQGPGAGGPYHGMGPGYGAMGPAFLVQTRLTDGALVTFDARQPADASSWPYRLLLSLAILSVAVIALTLLAARWVTRPLKTLASAAERLGEDVDQPPLDETGPLEVSRAAHAFNQMQQHLAKFIHDRTRIFAAMSHDLKTPITRLRLRAELLNDAAVREKFEQDLLEMEHMVKATLDFMRGLEHTEPVQPLDVMALLHTLQEQSGEVHGDVAIEGAAAAPYPGRVQALKRCLGNLVDNALQYGGSGTITVEDSHSQLRIRIRDRGPGIPDAQLELAFDPFYRIEASRSRSTGGTGLGLTIARSIARAHGGDVTLRNLPSGGLEALVILPRRAGSAPQ